MITIRYSKFDDNGKNEKKMNIFFVKLIKELKIKYKEKVIFKTNFLKKNEKIQVKKKDDKLINAAVICLIFFAKDKKSLNIILTLRSVKLKNHSGQVSFPGGKLEENDKGFIDCALRETYEEIGIPRENIKILGKLNKFTTGTGYLIQPVVATFEMDKPFRINRNEVQEVIFFPMKYMQQDKNLTTSYFKNNISNEIFFYYDILWKQYRIWGATAMILVYLKDIIRIIKY